MLRSGSDLGSMSAIEHVGVDFIDFDMDFHTDLAIGKDLDFIGEYLNFLV